jgi:hypothetical protein
MHNLNCEWGFPKRRRVAQGYLSALQELIARFVSGPDPKLDSVISKSLAG